MGDFEVPEREVEHGFAVEEYAWGDGFLPQGTVKEWTWWGGAKDDAAFRREMELREQARARLGGFGFGAHVRH